MRAVRKRPSQAAIGLERNVRPETRHKENPQKRWALPDRIFFGHGACAILAGTFLRHPPLEGFYGERIIPDEGFQETISM
ncbi:hypothetical protein NKH58_20605 [Mesorhizobium australicum]